MGTILNHLLSRRSFIATTALALPGLWINRASTLRAAQTAVIDGDCTDEAAVEVFFDWRSGDSPYKSLAEAGPQGDWDPFSHPSGLGPYLIPPDWTGTAAWADSFSDDGVPEWQDEPMDLPHLTLSRVESPEGDAVFEYAVGSIQNVLLSTLESAQIAKLSVLGSDPKLKNVCVIDDQKNQLAPGWFTVDRYKSDLLITFGNATEIPSNSLPVTVVSFTNLYGPRKEMEDLMTDVFLRILFQFMGGGTGRLT